jgi:hypothetical protein
MIDRSVKFRRTRRAVPLAVAAASRQTAASTALDRADTDAWAQSDQSDLDAVRGSLVARRHSKQRDYLTTRPS